MLRGQLYSCLPQQLPFCDYLHSSAPSQATVCGVVCSIAFVRLTSECQWLQLGKDLHFITSFILSFILYSIYWLPLVYNYEKYCTIIIVIICGIIMWYYHALLL